MSQLQWIRLYTCYTKFKFDSVLNSYETVPRSCLKLIITDLWIFTSHQIQGNTPSMIQSLTPVHTISPLLVGLLKTSSNNSRSHEGELINIDNYRFWFTSSIRMNACLFCFTHLCLPADELSDSEFWPEQVAVGIWQLLPQKLIQLSTDGKRLSWHHCQLNIVLNSKNNLTRLHEGCIIDT